MSSVVIEIETHPFFHWATQQTHNHSHNIENYGETPGLECDCPEKDAKDRLTNVISKNATERISLC